MTVRARCTMACDLLIPSVWTKNIYIQLRTK